MIRPTFYFFLFAFFLSTQGIGQSKASVPFYTFEEFEPLLHQKNDTTYIVNFWATWCGPCVKELPHFEAVGKEFSNQKVKVLLVSLDFEDQIEKRLLPFLKKKKIESEVVVLSDEGQNEWIDKVDPNWSGAIPITIIYRNNKRAFYERTFTHKELNTIVQSFLN